MKQILIILCLLWGTVQAQTIGYLRYDSVKIAKPGGNAELIIENATKAVTGGVLTNTGNGRSAWVASGGAWTPTWQQTLTAGSTLTTTNTIDGGGNAIYFDNLSDIHFTAVGVPPSSVPFIEFVSNNAITNRESSIDIQDDSINIKPSLGQIHIDTLNYSDAADDSMMVWQPSTGAVGMRAIPSGGSDANTALSNLAAVAINTSLISDANNTDDLGSSSLMWRTAYMGTSAFVPLVIGGTGTTDDLTFQTTTGAGTTGSFMDFLVGNNGAVNAMRINDVGGIGINTPTTIGATHALTIKSPTNTGTDGIQVYSNNETANIQYGSATIQSNAGLVLTAATTSIRLNSTLGTYVGSASTNATARLHITAGVATTGYAPLKFTTGTFNTTPAAGAMEYTTPQLTFVNGGLIRQELFQGQQSRVSTQYDNTTTTLGNVTGLTANVAAGKTYRFEAKLYTTSNVAGGVQFAIAGTATATAIIYEGLTTDAGLTTQGRSAALAGAVGAVTAVTAAYTTITGTITVNAAGTITCQFAQNASNGAASSVLVGSTFEIIEML